MEGFDDENYENGSDEFDDSCTEQVEPSNVYSGNKLV